MKFFTISLFIIASIAVINCKDTRQREVHDGHITHEKRDIPFVTDIIRAVVNFVKGIIGNIDGENGSGGSTSSSSGNNTPTPANSSSRMLSPSDEKLLRKLYKVIKDERKLKY